MALYVISDIHGEYDMFIAMLDRINFSEDDRLIVLGDIFDRGPKPLEVLEYIVTHKNIDFILGNHEEFFMDSFENEFRKDLDVWFMNGGEVTFNALMAKGDAYIKECYKYMMKTPRYMKIDSNDRKYLLCHAGVAIPPHMPADRDTVIKFQSTIDWLWNRDHLMQDILFQDFICVCGHTPTSLIEGTNDKPIIYKRLSMIYIDCGACFRDGRLGCIKIDGIDTTAYYVD